MATKPKRSQAPTATTAATTQELARTPMEIAGEDIETARVMTNGQCNALVVQQYLHYVNGGCDVQALSEVSTKDAQAISGGDFRSLEHMLLTQATALQAMFVDLATRAKRQDRFDGIQILTNLALKCAAQSRQAVTALAELKAPRSVMFATQANVTSGPQQINNVAPELAPPPASRAGEKQIPRNELLEASDGKRLDFRAAGKTGSADPRLETLEPGHGAAHRGGQG